MICPYIKLTITHYFKKKRKKSLHKFNVMPIYQTNDYTLLQKKKKTLDKFNVTPIYQTNDYTLLKIKEKYPYINLMLCPYIKLTITHYFK